MSKVDMNAWKTGLFGPQYMHCGHLTFLVCHVPGCIQHQCQPLLFVHWSVTSELQVPHGVFGPHLGSLGGYLGLSPIQNRASAETSPVGIKSSIWTACTSCCGRFPHLVNCCSGLNCFHSSRSTALGCLSILFLSRPAASESAHTCTAVIQVGPLPAQPRLGAFTVLIPLACCCCPFVFLKLARWGAPHRV